MNKALSLLTLSLFIASASSGMAETKTPVVVSPAATTSAAPASTATTTTPVVVNTVKAELKDGTKIEFGSDGIVSVIAADGSKTTAPDGIHTLKDGTTFNVKAGKRVSE